jgi:hypothetical protein
MSLEIGLERRQAGEALGDEVLDDVGVGLRELLAVADLDRMGPHVRMIALLDHLQRDAHWDPAALRLGRA